jgi:threonine dehydratase
MPARLSPDTIRQARNRLQSVVRHTALERSERLSRHVGRDVFLKLESRQRTGSFKIRGAFNMVAGLPGKHGTAGVIAASAGNHAQGVAYAAARAGIPATIVMPEGTPVIKVSETQRLGAEVILAGDGFDEAYEYATRLCEERGATFVHPFDDPDVISGQGTIALEVLEDSPEIDTFVVPVGGGGLISGIAVAAHAIEPDCRIIGVEPDGAAAMTASFEAGHLVALPSAASIADGVVVRTPGELTFYTCRQHLTGLVRVSDSQTAKAMLTLMEQHKLVVEGAGALPLAALDVIDPADLGQSVALIISGGNVDVNLLARMIDRGLMEAGRIVRMTVTLPDRPGALAALSAVLAEERANILEITHDRLRSNIDFGEAEVELLLATRGRDHIDTILEELTTRGYAPTEMD